MLSTREKSTALGVCGGRAVRQWEALGEWLDGLAAATPGRSPYHRSSAIKAKLELAARIYNHDPDALAAVVRAAVVRTTALASLEGG